MKNASLLMSVIFFSIACGDPSSNISTTVSKPISVVENKIIDSSREGVNYISISDAKNFSTHWRNLKGIQSCGAIDSDVAAYYVTRADIDAMPGDGGFRAYFGLNPDTTDHTHHLMLVSVDQNGNDEVKVNKIRNFSSPCPMVCDPAGLIWECGTLETIKLPVNGLAPVDSVVAKQYTSMWRSKHKISNDCSPSTSSQVKGYLISRDAVEYLIPANDSSIIGLRLYFGIQNENASERIFLMGVSVKQQGTDVADYIQNNSVLIFDETCPGDNCNCSTLARN